MRLLLFLALLAATAATSKAQWQLQDAHTTADLRGIDNVGGGVAWASGSDGTILRTEDAGFVWQLCAKPPGGEHLDFRGIQAFDNNTAIVMSSGKGELSRLYKTTDGCQSWKLIFTNPDNDGFWDALISKPDDKSHSGNLLGDPVNGIFQYFSLSEGEQGYRSMLDLIQPGGPSGGIGTMPHALPGESSFAASNSALIELPQHHGFAFGTGGSISKPRVISSICHLQGDYVGCTNQASEVPMASGPSAGIFSLAYRTITEDCPTQEEIEKFRRTNTNMLIPGPRCHTALILVAVGGDYMKPDSIVGTSSSITITEKNYRDPQKWAPPKTLPHGYRSAVAYDPKTKTWITVGPNGTDISTDDGRNWRALKPDPKFNDAPDADQHWNALSLPYAVGPHGRIGVLRPSALKQP